MKQTFFTLVRNTHSFFAPKQPPNHLGLYFHGLEEHEWDDFSKAISFFTKQGYVSLPSSAYARAPKDQKCLFISFDDNYKSWHTALPLFEKLGVKVTFYVNSLPMRGLASDEVIEQYFERIEYEGKRVSLSALELKELSDAGHEIGCHSHSHFVLSELPKQQWDEEILQSKNRLEQMIGKEVTSFSYPFGMRRHFSEPLRSYCLENGFQTIAAAIPGLQYDKDNPQNINRTRWHLHNPLENNLVDLCIDGRLFEGVTGKSAIG